ncbi:MAG: hypothetical protein ACLU62_06245 [Hydrogeniiclostridium sp.]
MKNLIERLREESLETENVKLIAANKAVALDNRQLRNELEQVKAERNELIRRNQSAYEIAWGCDIPSPTVPEYIELHEGMTRVMNALRGRKEEPK